MPELWTLAETNRPMDLTRRPSSLRWRLWLACLVLFSAGCNEYEGLDRQVRIAATAPQWQAWAVQVLERSKTNSVPPPRSEWPSFVARLKPPCSDWQLWIGTSNITLVSLGGFGSFGVDIGAASFIEPTNSIQRSSRQVYPGVYVRHN
jgi:hypothetical protein